MFIAALLKIIVVMGFSWQEYWSSFHSLLQWRRFLRILWITRSNQSILKEINPEYSSEGLMLKLQRFGHLMQRTHSLEKTLILSNS